MIIEKYNMHMYIIVQCILKLQWIKIWTCILPSKLTLAASLSLIRSCESLHCCLPSPH